MRDTRMGPVTAVYLKSRITLKVDRLIQDRK